MRIFRDEIPAVLGFSLFDQVPILTSRGNTNVNGVLWWGVSLLWDHICGCVWRKLHTLSQCALPLVGTHILTHQGPGEDEGPTPEFRVGAESV
jgi:hypothetical protein